MGNGIADRAADQPVGLLQTGLAPNPIAPVKWWTAIPGRPPEELIDTLGRNVYRRSKETDTADHISKRQGADELVEDWLTHVL